MENQAVVQVIGIPVACADGLKDAWRETAQWAAKQLAMRFGDSVRVEYFDLFNPNRPPLPKGAQLPLVMVNNRVVSSGVKISVPMIRKSLEELGVTTAFRKPGI
jgi:disulfide oxidoreductase YuzD